MKKTLSAVLLAASITASAQEMHFEGVQGIFNKDKAVSEICSYEVKDNEEGVPTLYVKLWNGAEYSTPAENVTITTTDRSTPSLSSKFNSLKYIVKDCSNIDNLEFGDFIGVANDEVFDFDELINKFYSMVNSYGIDPNTTYKPLIQTILAQFTLTNSVPIENIRFHSYSVIYVGSDPQGNKIPLSARFIYPFNINKDNLVKLDGFYVDNHCTVQQKGNEPSNYVWPFSSAPYCVKGYMSIMPDLVSFGSSAGYSQQFIDMDINGSGVAYSIVAAQQFVEWQKANNMAEFNIDSNPTVINAGTSQGATSALAATYFIENVMDKSKYNINLKETHVSSGAYDMKSCMDWYAKQDNIVYSVKIPIFFMGLMSAHHDLMKSSTGEQLYIKDFFSPRSAFVYTDADGKTWGNIWQILDIYRVNGVLAVPHTCSAMAFYGGKNPGANPSIHNMLSSDAFMIKNPNDPGYYSSAFDWVNSNMKLVGDFLDSNNLNNPKLWIPKSSIKLNATRADDMIPFSNTVEFYKNMILYTRKLSIEMTDDVPNVFGEHQANYGAHMAFCMVWYIAEMTDLSINIINEVMKDMLNKDKGEDSNPEVNGAKACGSQTDRMQAAFNEIIRRMQMQK